MVRQLTPIRRVTGAAETAQERDAAARAGGGAGGAIGAAIREARRALKLTQTDLADEFQIRRQTVANWEKGIHTPDVATLRRLERRLNVRTGVFTAGLQSRITVIGYVMAGDHGAQAIYEPHPLEVDEVLLPFASDPGLIWLQVRGASMMPVYRDGDLICYDADTPFVPESCLRRLCVVQTGDDRILVKILMPGSGPGRFDLISSNAEAIENTVIVWASPVKAAYYR